MITLPTSSLRFLVGLVPALLTSAALNGQVTTLISNMGASFSKSTSGAQMRTAGFTVGATAFTLDSITFKMNVTTSKTGPDPILGILADTGSGPEFPWVDSNGNAVSPGDTDNGSGLQDTIDLSLVEATLSVSSGLTDGTDVDVTFTPDSAFTFQANTTYWITNLNGSVANVKAIPRSYQNISATDSSLIQDGATWVDDGGNIDGFYSDSSANPWGSSSYAPMFSVAVPEPSTYALMLGGLALAGVLLRRRRRS